MMYVVGADLNPLVETHVVGSALLSHLVEAVLKSITRVLLHKCKIDQTGTLFYQGFS